MELHNFIQNNKIEDFDKLKKILEESPYNLKIKEDLDLSNLFLIHSTDNSDFTLKIVNECNGIILDKNGLKIVCYTFDKCIDTLSFPETFDMNNLYNEAAIEGTLMRVYFNNNKWIFSTKKCIDASKSTWLSSKNFIELFIDCLMGYDILYNLNKNNCYSFIIEHPENNIVVKSKSPILYHIATRDMNTLNELEEYVGILKLTKNKVSSENLDILLSEIINDKTLNCEGFIFIDNDYKRWKLRSSHFNYVRKLWGNSNNKFYRYLELRKNVSELNEYLIYFQNDRDIFIDFETKINDFSLIILEIYINKHIKKINNKIPYYFSKIIYKIHGDYLKDRILTNQNKVMISLLELDAKKLCFMMNCYEKSIKNNEDCIEMENMMEI